MKICHSLSTECWKENIEHHGSIRHDLDTTANNVFDWLEPVFMAQINL